FVGHPDQVVVDAGSARRVEPALLRLRLVVDHPALGLEPGLERLEPLRRACRDRQPRPTASLGAEHLRRVQPPVLPLHLPGDQLVVPVDPPVQSPSPAEAGPEALRRLDVVLGAVDLTHLVVGQSLFEPSDDLRLVLYIVRRHIVHSPHVVSPAPVLTTSMYRWCINGTGKSRWDRWTCPILSHSACLPRE